MEEAIKIISCLLLAMTMGGLAGAGVRDIYKWMESNGKL